MNAATLDRPTAASVTDLPGVRAFCRDTARTGRAYLPTPRRVSATQARQIALVAADRTAAHHGRKIVVVAAEADHHDVLATVRGLHVPVARIVTPGQLVSRDRNVYSVVLVALTDTDPDPHTADELVTLIGKAPRVIAVASKDVNPTRAAVAHAVTARPHATFGDRTR